MPHYLNINQLAEEAAAQGLDDIVTALEEAAQQAAIAISATRGDVLIIEDASNEVGFAGLCVGFGPICQGLPCPDDFAPYDACSDWATGE